MTSHYTRRSVTTLHGVESLCWEGLWTLSFELSQFHGHGSRLVCEVALRTHTYSLEMYLMNLVSLNKGYNPH